MNVLEELFFGQLHPSEKTFLPGSEYDQQMQVLVENKRELIAYLRENPAQASHLTQMCDAMDTLARFDELDRFLAGFTLGARFMLDTFVAPPSCTLRDRP